MHAAEPVLTEPRRLQRAQGLGALSVKLAASATRIENLRQEGAAKLRFPSKTSAALEAVLINTAGGLTGGDRFAWDFAAGHGTALSLTSQACEKIYRAGSGHSEVSVSLSVGECASLAWLPQETIVYNDAALRRAIHADLAENASLILAESVIFGRTAMGETVITGSLADRWRIRSKGRLVHAEDLSLGPSPDESLAFSAIAGGGRALATLLCIGPDAEGKLEPLRLLFAAHSGQVSAGASHVAIGGTGKLLARIIAKDGISLRQVLAPALALLNGKAGLPKIWTS